MKKILLSLLVLLIFTLGWGFYVWQQIQIPPGHTGVLFTKTSGVLTPALRTGDWYFTWQLMLPGNTRVEYYPDLVWEEDWKVQGELPSGGVYGKIIQDEGAFEYQLEGTITGRSARETLAAVVRSAGISGPQWKSYLEESKKKVRTALHRWASAPDTKGMEVPAQVFRPFPQWEALGVELKVLRLPDTELYDKIRSRLQGLQDTGLQERIQNRAQEIEALFKENDKILWLERYGKLIKEYPGLVELWKLAPQLPELKPLLPALPY